MQENYKYKFFYKLNWSLYFLLFTLVSNFSSLLATEKKSITLKWQKVQTAISYIIEVEDENGKQVLKQEVSQNFISIELEPGNYKRKISVINKLGEVESESDWKNFIVQRILEPEIQKGQNLQATKENSGVISLKGKNFHPAMKVKLRKEEKIYILEKSKVIDSENAEIVVNPEIPEGDYDLILENPANKKSEFAQVVQKKSTQEPKPTEKPKDPLRKWEIVKRSAILSGWGEYYAGSKLQNPNYDFRGKVYFGSFVALFSLYLYFNEFTLLPTADTPTQKKFKEKSSKDLATAIALPNLSNNSRRIFALYALNEMNKQAELVNQQSQRVNLILLLMAGVYITQLVDAYLIEKKEIPEKEAYLYPKFQFQFDVKNHWNIGTESLIKFQYNLFF